MTGLRLADGPVIPNFGQPSACLRHNGWFCTDWIHEHWGDTLQPALIQHIQLTLIAVGIGFVIAFALALVALRFGFLDPPLGVFTDFLYVIPSLALFQLLVPLSGVTVTTVEIALVSYTLFILYRNIVVGLRSRAAGRARVGARHGADAPTDVPSCRVAAGHAGDSFRAADRCRRDDLDRHRRRLSDRGRSRSSDLRRHRNAGSLQDGAGRRRWAGHPARADRRSASWRLHSER